MTLYTTPWVDKGKGNKIWMDSLTKKEHKYKEGKAYPNARHATVHTTKWLRRLGKKERNNWGLATQYRVLIVCPYTYPRLYVETDPYYGYVMYSESFGAGQMPDKNPYVPVTWRGKWYPHILHQESVIK